jgi:signal transduction histidine kinase
MLRLTIRDNGSGFDPETAIRPTSLGLLSMRERAAAIGATFTVVSRAGGGAAIIVERAHTGSVMSDDVLADLMLIDRSGGGADYATATSDAVHNGNANSGGTEGAPDS